MSTIKYRGVVEVSEDIDMDKMLAKLPLEMRNKAAQDAVREDVKFVAKAWRARVGKGKTGNLKKSITHRVVAYQDNRLWFGLAGTIKPTGNHMHLIDLGHKVFARGPIGDSAAKKRISPLTGSATVEGKGDLLKTINATKGTRDKRIMESLAKSIKKVGG